MVFSSDHLQFSHWIKWQGFRKCGCGLNSKGSYLTFLGLFLCVWTKIYISLFQNYIVTLRKSFILWAFFICKLGLLELIYFRQVVSFRPGMCICSDWSFELHQKWALSDYPFISKACLYSWVWWMREVFKSCLPSPAGIFI